jgi:hypothetical protein
MAISNELVANYIASVSMSSTNDIERTIRLTLEDGSAGTIRFVQTQPDEWVVFTEDLVEVFLPLRFFKDTVRLLQTEAPIRFLARADEDPPLFFASVSTNSEEPGEGPADRDATG